MGDNLLVEKSKIFAKEIIFTIKDVRKEHREFALTDQLLRSGTSIGANIHEANYAQGRADFISKLEIALKECYESDYWLELMVETEYISEEKYKKLSHDCGELRHLLITSCKTAKSKNRNIPQSEQCEDIIERCTISSRSDITAAGDIIARSAVFSHFY